MCRSTGLDPIAHPPGKETRACPYFASKGPKTKTPALIVLTRLYGAINFLFFLEVITISFLESKKFIFLPMLSNKLIIVEISFTSGIFFKIIFSSTSNVAARIGREAFLDPEILIVPKSFLPP